MKRLKEFISNINHFNNNNNTPDPHIINEIINKNKIFNDLIREGILCHKTIKHNGHEYLITWTFDKYKSDFCIHLYEYIGVFVKMYCELYHEYDSDMRKNIGNTKTYYIEAAKKLFSDYQEQKSKEIEETNYTTSQLKEFYEWDGKIE